MWNNQRRARVRADWPGAAPTPHRSGGFNPLGGSHWARLLGVSLVLLAWLPGCPAPTEDDDVTVTPPVTVTPTPEPPTPTATPAADSDSDGVADGLDCAPQDPAVFPGNAEVCDEKDNNCDGSIDEGVQLVFYTDLDGDGFGTSSKPQPACSQPPQTSLEAGDCDDTLAAVNPDAVEVCDGQDNDCDGDVDEALARTYFEDQDDDGYGNTSQSVQACSLPEGYASTPGDCDDADMLINPDAVEVCDGIDNNCVDGIDEEVSSLYFQDSDGDGHGNPAASQQACSQPEGYVLSGDDCNDADASTYPGAPELCGSVDLNCDGIPPEGLEETFYPDGDKDGYGDTQNPKKACAQPEGYVKTSGDCNDQDAAISPAATEICDKKDNNCSGQADEGLELTSWYPDTDADGYGISQGSLQDCQAIEGYAAQAGDCDDASHAVNPGASEVCDGLDNNCNGQSDEGLTFSSWYTDGDGDGYGLTSSATSACAQPQGRVSQGGDCDDANSSLNPGAAELCDGLDNNCSGQADEGLTFSSWYVDGDGDGYGVTSSAISACAQPQGRVPQGGDCDDANSSLNPGAAEICDGLDNNCSGQADEGLGSTTYYADTDGDGYGDAGTGKVACQKPQGWVTNGDDCDDTRSAVYPGAEELCDGLDNNCSGQLDEGLGWLKFYPDMDNDGFGETAGLVYACAAPPAYVEALGDCADDDDTRYPGAPDDLGDGIDQDCGGSSQSLDGQQPSVGLDASEFLSLQAAINAASAGMNVWVGPDTYTEFDISLKGKALVFSATHGPDYTIIDAQGKGRVLNLSSGESSATLVRGFTVENGSAATGAGIYTYDSSPVFTDMILVGNSASTSGGGFHFSGGSPQIRDSQVQENVTPSNYGGGGAVVRNASARIERVDFLANSARWQAAGLYLDAPSTVVSGCSFEANLSGSGWGAALYATKFTGEIRNAYFVANGPQSKLANGRGGAIYLDGGSPKLTNILLERNSTGSAASFGGAVYLANSSATLTSCVISRNSSGTGGGIRIEGGSPSFVNVVVTGNTATTGGGVQVTGTAAKPMFNNSILAFNSSYNLYNDPAAAGTVTLAYSVLYVASGSSHNLSSLPASNQQLDPLFYQMGTDGAPDDFHLSLSSPVIDTGDPGLADVDGSRADPGCYGGIKGGTWDLDRDAYTDYFWPGALDDAPQGYNPDNYDCNDFAFDLHLCL